MGNICPKELQKYHSAREVEVENWRIAAIYWFIVILVIFYVIIETIIINKGYQISDEAVGTVSTKVKGTASTGDFNDWHDMTVYDAMDIIHPSVESNALFLTTAFVDTPSQTRGVCDGNPDIDLCENDNDCSENEHNWKSQGVLTGKCGTNGRCQVLGWCPLEDDTNAISLNNIGRFTVFVKNDIRFPNFNIETTNAKDYENSGRLTFGKNLFVIDDIVGDATHFEYNTSMLATSGAIILVDIDWSCNLDAGLNECDPQFTFERIDNDGDGISTGFNFRTVVYTNDSNTRQLKKLYGIRITFISSGRASRFDFVALFITLGAGIAYLGVAKLVTDVGLSYLMKDNPKYQKLKSIAIPSLVKQKTSRNIFKDAAGQQNETTDSKGKENATEQEAESSDDVGTDSDFHEEVEEVVVDIVTEMQTVSTGNI